MGEIYSTSYEDMVKERDLWEKVMENSTTLLDIIYENDPDNYFVAKYINILFGMRCFSITKTDFDSFLLNCENIKSINNFDFHRRFRSFMADIDSVLDYTDKFFKVLKERKANIYFFSRKDQSVKRISDEISLIRNSLLHEGVPTLYTDRQQRYVGYNPSPCHANVAGSSNFEYTVFVRVQLTDSLNKTYNVRELTCRYFEQIYKLLKDLTSHLIEVFTENPEVLAEI